jgi:hypothetical protein
MMAPVSTARYITFSLKGKIITGDIFKPGSEKRPEIEVQKCVARV